VHGTIAETHLKVIMRVGGSFISNSVGGYSRIECPFHVLININVVTTNRVRFISNLNLG